MSGKDFTDFTIFSSLSSHIFTLAIRNFAKFTQKLCVMIFLIVAKFKVSLSTETWLKLQIWQKFRKFHDISLFSKPYLHINQLKFHKTHPKVVSYDVFDNSQVKRNSIDRNMVKMGKLAKILLILRYFLVFQVISSDWLHVFPLTALFTTCK